MRGGARRGRLGEPLEAGALGVGIGDDDEELLHRPDGLGLGLRVARRIAALHGGAIVFEQREDRGSRAVVSLPIRPPEGGAVLRTPRTDWDRSGGFSDLMVELSAVLPYEAFLPADLE